MPKKIKPELWIFYSDIYDLRFTKIDRNSLKREEYLKDGLAHRAKIQTTWDKVERKVFDALSKISGLDWHRPAIECYIVRRCIPFSQPLTVPILNRKGKKIPLAGYVGLITHELTHQLIVSNYDRIKKVDWSKKYGPLNIMVKNHILVNAILALAYPLILGKTRAKKTIEFEKKLGGGDYAKAWKIVEQEGAENIIKKMIKK